MGEAPMAMLYSRYPQSSFFGRNDVAICKFLRATYLEHTYYEQFVLWRYRFLSEDTSDRALVDPRKKYTRQSNFSLSGWIR